MSKKTTHAGSAPAVEEQAGEAASAAASPATAATAAIADTATPAAPAGGEENTTVQALEGAADTGQTDAPDTAGDAASSTVGPSAAPALITAYRVVGIDLLIDGKRIPENGTVELDYEPSAKTLRRLEPVSLSKEGKQ